MARRSGRTAALMRSLREEGDSAVDDRALERTRELLTEWGLWVHEASGRPMGYANTLGELMRRASDREVHGRPRLSCISDDQAIEIERAVAALRAREYRTAYALVQYYTNNHMPHWRLAEILHTSRATAQRILLAGEYWVDARLSGGSLTGASTVK